MTLAIHITDLGSSLKVGYANMSTMLLETAEGLGEPIVKGAGGEIWNMLQSEKENVCKHLADDGLLCNCAPVMLVESEPSEGGDCQIEWRHRSDMKNHLREIIDA